MRAWVVALLVAGCTPAPPPRAAAPPPPTAKPPFVVPSAAPAPRDDTPPAGITPLTALPGVVLEDGVRRLPRSELPLAVTALVIHGGSGDDGADLGAAEVAAQLMALAVEKHFQARVSVDADAIVLEVAHHSADFAKVEQTLGAALKAPPLAALEQARKRALAAPRDLGREALARELFLLPTGRHPYGHPHAPRSAIEKITAQSVLAFLRRQKGVELVSVGDVTQPTGRYSATMPSAPPTPLPEPGLRIVVVQAAGTPEVQVGTLAPGDAAHDVALALASDRAPAGTRWFSEEHPTGPALMGLERDADDATAAVQSLLDALGGATQADSDAIDVTARRVADAPLVDLPSIAGAAAVLEHDAVLGLDADAFDARRRARRDVEPKAVLAAAKQLARKNALVVTVTGDANPESLTAIAPVWIVDPARDFVVERKLPFDPTRRKAP